MIGKILGLMLIMTVSIILVPVNATVLFRRIRKMRGYADPSNPTTTALCCRCMSEYEAGHHGH